MKRIFITGMSGTGKSSVIAALSARGFAALDTDYGDWCRQSCENGEGEWLWREERMLTLLSTPLTLPLFVSGCVANQTKFFQYFDHKILLHAPLEVILERVAGRTNNDYGKSAEEREEIGRNYAGVVPLLKKSCDVELDTAVMSVDEVTDCLATLAL